MSIILVILFTLLGLVYSDDINITNPVVHQVIKNASFSINYSIQRNTKNNNLFITNTTTQLFDAQNNTLISYDRAITNSTNVRILVQTLVKKNAFQNFTIKIIAFGISNTSMNSTYNMTIPFQINLLNNNNQTTTTATATTTTTTLATTASMTATATTSATTTMSSGVTIEAAPAPTMTIIVETNNADNKVYNVYLMLMITAITILYI